MHKNLAEAEEHSCQIAGAILVVGQPILSRIDTYWVFHWVPSWIIQILGQLPGGAGRQNTGRKNERLKYRRCHHTGCAVKPLVLPNSVILAVQVDGIDTFFIVPDLCLIPDSAGSSAQNARVDRPAEYPGCAFAACYFTYTANCRRTRYLGHHKSLRNTQQWSRHPFPTKNQSEKRHTVNRGHHRKQQLKKVDANMPGQSCQFG